jgi:hypothetical protein
MPVVGSIYCGMLRVIGWQATIEWKRGFVSSSRATGLGRGGTSAFSGMPHQPARILLLTCQVHTCLQYCNRFVLVQEKCMTMLAYAPSSADCCDPSIMEEFYIEHWRTAFLGR